MEPTHYLRSASSLLLISSGLACSAHEEKSSSGEESSTGFTTTEGSVDGTGSSLNDKPPSGAGGLNGSLENPGSSGDPDEVSDGEATPLGWADRLWTESLVAGCANQYSTLGDFAQATTIEGNQLVFRTGSRFSNETWGEGLRGVFFRAAGTQLEYLGYQETSRAPGSTEARLTIPREWLEGQIVYYASYERKVVPMQAAVGTLLAWHDSGLFSLNRGDCVESYSGPAESGTFAGWTRLQHPQGALNDHAVFTEFLDPVRKSASHFMNVPRFRIDVIQDQWGEDLIFDVEFVFASDTDRPVGGLSSIVGELEASGQEGQEERAGAPPGSPRHVFSHTCTETSPNNYRCNLGQNFSYGQRVDWELRVVPSDTMETNLYTPMIYYVVGQGFSHESADPRAHGGGFESIDSWGADPAERAASFSQHTRLESIDEVMHFVAEHDDFRQPIGTDLEPGRTTCESCHINDGRSEVVFEVPDVGPRIAPPLIGLGLLARVVQPGRVYFGWEGNRITVEDAVRTALAVDFGVEAPDSELLAALTHYSENLGVPQRDKSLLFDPRVLAGEALFRGSMGCAACHTEVLETSDGVVIRPYTDLLAHDLGQGPFRTAPLWALGRTPDVVAFSLDEVPPGQEVKNAALGRAQRYTPAPIPDSVLYLHDGSARGLDEAIRAHGGQASASSAAYASSSAQEREQLLAFLRSL